MVRIKRNTEGFLFAVAFAVGLSGIAATRSPVGMLLAVASCAAVLFAVRRREGFWALGFGTLVIAAVVLFRPDVLRLEPFVLRLDNWGSALWVWSTAPVVGVGLGGFGQAAQSIPWPVGNHPVHAHSLPLEILADMGVFGLAAWALATVGLFRVVRRLWSQRPEVAVALLVIPTHNLVDFSFYTTAVALPWAVLMGWSLALTRSPGEVETPVSRSLRWIPVLAGAGAVAIAILSLTGFTLKEAAQGPASLEQRRKWVVRAASLTPWDVGAVELVGAVALESKQPRIAQESLALLKNRQWQRPRSASRAQLIGRLRALAGDPVGGLVSLWQAQERQPYDQRRREDFEIAVERLEGGRRADR